jgi:hypothetical protein
MIIFPCGGEKLKKLVSIVTAFTFVLLSGVISVPSKADAAWSSWTNLGSGCSVRVWVDAYTYTSSATSIDVIAEQNGACGQLSYEMFVVGNNNGQISPKQSGYFSSITPRKYFYFSDFPSGMRSNNTSGYVAVSTNKGIVYSHDINF